MQEILNYAWQVAENTWWIPIVIALGWSFGDFVVFLYNYYVKGEVK